MKKNGFLFLFLMILFPVFCQTNSEIKKHSQDNNQQKNNSSSSGSGNSGSSSNNNDTNSYSDNSSGSCIDGCVASIGCADLMTSMFVGIAQANRQYVERKKDDVSYISHFEMALHVGFLPNNYVVYQPRITGQYGVFGTDFRVYHNREYRIAGTDPYTTSDWQILLLNLVSVKEFNLRIGSGIMVERFDGVSTTFNEHTAMIKIFPAPRFRLNLEGRLAPDYQTNMMVRKEVNMNLSYQLNQSERTKVNVFFGGLYAKYYQAVDVWTLGVGANIIFE